MAGSLGRAARAWFRSAEGERQLEAFLRAAFRAILALMDSITRGDDRENKAAEAVFSSDVVLELDRLCHQFRVRSLVLFGSANTAAFDPERSDVDLIAEFDDVQAGDKVAQYFDFKDALERLLRRPVDLLTKAPIRNPYLRRSIEQNQRRLFPRP